jgi:hypothetical protein
LDAFLGAAALVSASFFPFAGLAAFLTGFLGASLSSESLSDSDSLDSCFRFFLGWALALLFSGFSS